MKKTLCALLLLVATPDVALSADLIVGETLSCTSRHPDRSEFVVIGKIDTMGPSHRAISVTFYDRGPGALVPEAAHLPIEEAALRASCTTEAPALPLSPNLGEGYAQWREAVDAGRAGAFTISLDEIEDYAAKLIRSQTTGGGGNP